MYKQAGIPVFIVAVLIIAGMVTAAEGQDGETQQDIFLKQGEVEQTERTLEAFTHAVDLWHDANLKGDDKLIAKYQEQLEKLIDVDLDHARSQVTRQHRQMAQTALIIERRRGERRWEERIDDRSSLREQENDYYRAQNWLAVKKRLAESIAKTEVFSAKLRLLNTYTEALKRQFDSESFELAQDMRELEQDAERFVIEKQD